MAKGMLSLTVALLLSAMCTVEVSGAAAAAAAGGGGGDGSAAAAAASAGGRYSGLGYGGGGYLPSGYGGGGYLPSGYGGGGYLPSGYNSPQYVFNQVPYTYLPRRYTSSYVVAPTVEKKRVGLGVIDDILNGALKIKALNNSNGAVNPANTS